MLRPATPLSIALLAAFGLLLIATLSVPIIKGIPLGSFEGITYGVFGLCNGDKCSGIEIGYDTAKAGNTEQSTSFDLTTTTRTTLSAILVVHPVAALFTLIMFILAVASHFHAPSHSSRFLLVVFIVSIIDFLVCLLAFLVDVLLFAPHMAWGSYIVLAATILVAISSLVSCAMRRIVVGRKVRKKRIAENAEMSGENFYNRQAEATAMSSANAPLQPTMPVLSGANGANDKLPEFASFEKKQDDRSSDERVPLTARSPSERSPNNVSSELTPSQDMPYNGPIGPNAPRRSMSSGMVQRDQYGNPIEGPPDAYGVRRGPSFEQMNARGRGGMAPAGYRGRGGFGPGPGRGGIGGYTPNGRGGYGPPGRGGMGPPPPGRGGYGPPPRGYGGPMRGAGRPPPPGYQAGPPGAYDPRGSPGAYAPYGRQSPSSQGTPGYSNPSMPSVSTGGYEAYTPEADRETLPRAESPPPLPGQGQGPPGQAVEMDAVTGSPAHAPQGFGHYGIRDSDADVAGIVALQQARAVNAQRHDTYMSDTSKYSQDEAYIPPRSAWNQNSGRNSPRMPSPLNVPGRSAEMQSRSSPAPPAPAAGEYYEDVDPRFATGPVHRPTPPPIQTTNTIEEDIPQGARSPAESDRSNFTSISQRGINPRWNAPPPPPGGFMRRPVPPRQPDILSGNPDFELPAARGSPSRMGPGMVPGSSYPNNV